LPAPILTRTVFHTKRAMEFFTEKELTMQIGFDRQHWPLALVKELLDNALDACETGGVPPDITITLTDDTVSIQDNGPGLPLSILTDSLDYMERVSDKAYYVSPTRGQLGNALKCVWAAPFVAHGREGCIEVQSAPKTGAYQRQIRVRLDRIAQQPVLSLTEPSEEDFVKTGTSITIHWEGIA